MGSELIEQLKTLNKIAATLNRAVDVRGALESALAHLVRLMELETGWIFLVEPLSKDKQWGKGFHLIAHHNLPPALAIDNPEAQRAWLGGCDCQAFCLKGKLTEAYNEVRCTRLEELAGDLRGLAVHASAPLQAGDRVLGILNVAGPDWEAFSSQALELLTNVGNLMAAALERARLFDLLQQRHIEEQTALLAFSNKLLGQHDLPEMMNFLVREVCHLLNVEACVLLLPSPIPGQLSIHAATGWQDDPMAAGYFIPDEPDYGPGMVMRSQEPLLIEDFPHSDIADTAPEWLQAEGFRGHAIVPLLANDIAIGALVINSRQSRLWDEDDVQFLQLMANQAAIALETARLHESEIQQNRLEEELAIGRQIQLSMLPEFCPAAEKWQLAAFYQAARQVGGDFYDFYEFPSGQLGMVIADVAGKGVPAALFMTLSRTIMRTIAFNRRAPKAVLSRCNEIILRDNQSEMFLTAGYAVVDLADGQLTYANGGHNPPLWYQSRSGQVMKMQAKGVILGAFPQIMLEECVVQLESGDVVLFYTDGVTEAVDAAGYEFGERRLIAALEAHVSQNAEAIVQAIVSAVHAFIGSTTPADDLTLFVLKRE